MVGEGGGGVLEYVVTERMGRHMFETVDIQNIYCLIELTARRSFKRPIHFQLN
jgi:hypothetical protein